MFNSVSFFVVVAVLVFFHLTRKRRLGASLGSLIKPAAHPHSSWHQILLSKPTLIFADNKRPVMMFSAEHPLQSDCGQCLFGCISLAAEWSGLLLPLLHVQMIFKSISHKVEETQSRRMFYVFVSPLADLKPTSKDVTCTL